MSHLSWREIEDLACGDARPSDEVRGHLRACPLCAQRLEQLRAVFVAARGLAADQVPDGRDAVKQAVGAAPRVRRMSCRAVRGLLDSYLDGALDEGLTARLEAHLFTCATCYRAWRELLDLRGAAASLPAEAPPDGLRERIHARVAAEAAAAVPSRPPVRWARPAWLAAAASLVVVVGLAVMLTIGHQAPPPAPAAPGVTVATAEVPATPTWTPRPVQPAAPAAREARTPPEARRERVARRPARREAARARVARSRHRRMEGRPSTPEPEEISAAGTALAAAPVTASTRPTSQPAERRAPAVPVSSPAPKPEAIAVLPARPAPAERASSPGTSEPATSTTATERKPTAAGSESHRPSGAAPTPPAPEVPSATGTPRAPEVRLAAAGEEAGLRWLPVRGDETEHVVVSSPTRPSDQLARAAARINRQLAADEAAERDGWIAIK